MKNIKIFTIIIILIILSTLTSCISFQKQSPLLTFEYLEGMPLILEFSRPVIKVEIFDRENLIYSYNGDIIYELKTNLILHNDVTVKITEFYKNREYINILKKIEPDIQFLLYGGADNSLDSKYNDPITGENDYFFDLDISEIRKSIKKSNINIVINILSDRYAKNDEIIFISNFRGNYFEYVYTPDKLDFSAELSSASTSTMFKFLDILSVKNNKTIKILDLWDHGNGWAWEARKSINIQPKAIIQDDTSNKVLKIKDIKSVIQYYDKKYSTKIDILAFDACNMMSIEIMYEFKDLVDYFIGSVYSIAGLGFYYNFFHDLDEDNLKESLVYKIIEQYNYYYTVEYHLDRLSLSAVNLNYFSWDKIQKTNNINTNYVLYKNDGNNYVSEPTNMIDINNLILNNGEYLADYINPAIINSVVRIDGINYPEYSGIGIMFEDIFTTNPNGYYDDYKALSFYDEFQNWIETTWKNIIQNQ
ncbi:MULTISPECIES: clostripain-related cysteine peptidase [unclassified Marinitoga]|uniref:clostripain-related cysteine peptidase n=1 Tax=unclassified Marinitoga TaxID=2640159 RepID=UPI000640FF9F|nr:MULTISPECIES: clostripain-related cysteine peptidase [unclassified Marinitoga]KLO21401.1 hypothetical protein X274_10470 [Marinitoga sp. 1155]NUU99815.1 hypothetical protein [Marinitoga sp. 1154]